MALLTESDALDACFEAPSLIEGGYDLDQVGFLLDEVAGTIAQLTAQKVGLENESKKAQTRTTELENSGVATGRSEALFSAATTTSFAPVEGGAAGGGDTNAVAGMLASARQLRGKYISDGKAEADHILAEANAESQRIIAEAEEQHNRTLIQLEQERGPLEHKTLELRDFERDYCTRFESYLESLLADVESGPTPSSDQR